MSRNGNANHASLPSRHMRQTPSQHEIDSLQSRIRNMLSNDTSPHQSLTEPNSPTSFRGRGRGSLYYSPPLRRGMPPTYNNASRNGRPYSREGPYDNCEDIAAFALGIVKSLEIPDDERQEKEDFCKDLEEIVRRIRPSIPTLLGAGLMCSGQGRAFWKFCEYLHDCELRY